MERKLRFKEDGSFRILQLTDIHYTEDDERDHRTVALMRDLISREKPDFIITTGDTVYGEKNMEYGNCRGVLDIMTPNRKTVWGTIRLGLKT